MDLLAHVSDAWLWTAANKRGLFSAASAPVAVNPSAAEPEGGPEPASAGPDGTSAHHAWLMFLLEVWQVHSCTHDVTCCSCTFYAVFLHIL